MWKKNFNSSFSPQDPHFYDIVYPKQIETFFQVLKSLNLFILATKSYVRINIGVWFGYHISKQYNFLNEKVLNSAYRVFCSNKPKIRAPKSTLEKSPRGGAKIYCLHIYFQIIFFYCLVREK